jgi:catechol 2,3-dioxygenase-like lactoylglutathione lyase family enzyme
MSETKNQGKYAVFRSNSEIAIHVTDLAQAEAFYGGVLGFQVIARNDEQLEFDTGALRLYVNRDETLRSYIPSFDVPDLEAAKRHLEAAGCKTAMRASETGVTYYLDSFGFAFDIVERHRLAND